MSERIQRFYGQRAGIYDAIARFTPGVKRWRAAAVDALDLPEGGTAVDVGCGTGATLRLLSEAVGPRGRVVGLDLTPALLERAWTETSDLPNVQLIRGDASRPPIEGPVDGLLASFVVGLLEDPARAVDDWRSIVGPEGRVALLDGVPTGWAHPFDRGFARLVRAGAPPGSRDGASDRLRRRVEAAHGALRVGSEASSRTSWLAGLVRLTAAGGGPGSCQGSP